MSTLLRRLRPDPYVLALLATVGVAALVPASGAGATVADSVTDVAIAGLFFLYGARLSSRAVLDGLKHWRLHLMILAFTFVLFPILGLAMKPLDWILAPGLYMGILYMTLVPSTVQSSVNFTSIAHGNVAGSIVSASASSTWTDPGSPGTSGAGPPKARTANSAARRTAKRSVGAPSTTSGAFGARSPACGPPSACSEPSSTAASGPPR